MKFLPFTILLLIAASCPGQSDKGEEITTELVTLALGRGVPAYYYGDRKDVVKLETSTRGIGAPVTYRGPTDLLLYLEPSGPNGGDGKGLKPKPALTVSLPTGQNRILLIFTTSRTGQGSQTKVRALGIATDKMKSGDYRIYNFARKGVYVVMNKAKAIIQPGKSADITSTSLQSDIQDMVVRFGLKDGDGLRQVYSSAWGHRPERRSFLFIFDRDDKYSPFEIRRYHDVPQARTSASE